MKQDRDKNYEDFLDCLMKAAEKIEENYFKLPVQSKPNNGKEYRYRERFYCYELYHQLRCLLGDEVLSRILCKFLIKRQIKRYLTYTAICSPRSFHFY